MVNTKEYILTRFGEYSGLNPEFIQSFNEWDGQGIQNFLRMFISKSVMSWVKEKKLYDDQGYIMASHIDFDEIVYSSSLFGVCCELSKVISLSGETSEYINRRSGFYCYDDKYLGVGFREVVESCFKFERITTNIAYRKARDWFFEIYWNPHYVWGRKFLENRINRDEIFN